MGHPGIFTAQQGLTTTGTSVRLGGSLMSDTSIGTDSAGYLVTTTSDNSLSNTYSLSDALNMK